MPDLLEAIQAGNERLVRTLLYKDKGVVLMRDTGLKRQTPLMMAAQLGYNDIAQALIDCGAIVDATDMDGNTALSLAANSGKRGIVQLLLKSKANKEATNENGQRALHLAAKNGNPAVVRLLLKEGADAKAKDDDEKTPLQLASNDQIAGLLKAAQTGAQPSNVPTGDTQTENAQPETPQPKGVQPEGTQTSGNVPDSAEATIPSKAESVDIWNGSVGYFANVFQRRVEAMSSANISPDSNLVGTAGARMFWIWPASGGKEVKVPHSGPGGYISSIAFSHDNKRVAVSSNNEITVYRNDIGTKNEVARFVNSNSASYSVYGLAFSPDGTLIATGDENNIARIWDISKEGSEREKSKLTGHTGIVRGVEFRPDGKQLVSVSDDTTVRQWDTESGGLIREIHPTDKVRSAKFSPDGKLIVIAAGTLQVWNAKNGNHVLQMDLYLNQATQSATHAAFSPDQSLIVAGLENGGIALWETSTYKKVRILTGHKKEVIRVAISPDGRRITSICSDGSVGLWEAGASVESVLSRSTYAKGWTTKDGTDFKTNDAVVRLESNT
ncbi:WD40-repeat-containing domain protein [Nemania sp. FL0916]|nr:WD40-repeat-containing domain protein [Nemania sp. FL0916]